MDIDLQLADRVLALVAAPDYRPLKPKQIAAELELDGDGYREIRRIVKQLVKEGRLLYGGNHLVMSPGALGGPADVTRGTFRRARGGHFGFVRPAHAEKGGEVPDDYFVPPGMTGGALDGDLVEIELRSGRRGETEARVLEVVERSRRQFTGTVSKDGDRAQVHLDGTPFEHPVDLGDTAGLPIENEDKVFVELVKFPGEEGQGGQAILIERLGSNRNPAIDTLTIMRQYGLADDFPEDVIEEARRHSDAFDDSSVPEGRLDLTGKLTITIDPHDARDFDDAISLDREDGRWRLWVHIADVSHFVPIGGAIDREARARATSVYLPGQVVPMIPEIISNHLASLQPERLRYAKTVEIEILDDLTITHTEVHNTAIHSDLRLNYDQVDRFLEDRDGGRQKYGDDVCDLLGRMHELSMRMRKARFKSGSLSMDMPEIKLSFDRSGKVKGAFKTEHTESHQIIEEFMLAANEAVATWLDDRQLSFLHRIHAPPERRKLRQLATFVKDIGIEMPTLESRFEIQEVLDRVAGTPLEDAVNFAVLKAMSKAVYGPQVEGHYALDIEHYCHFTSPIRRYPDLTVHRLVQRLIEGHERPDDAFSTLIALGHHCSDMERNAQAAERELVELKLLHFLRKHVGETMPAVISRVFADGLEARCTKLPVDGYVSVRSLPKDQYRFERRGNVLSGHRAGNRFRLGDQLLVQIDRVDLQDRQLYWKVLKNHSAQSEVAGGGTRREGRSQDSKPYRGKRKKERRDKRKRRGR
ncbi:MAG: VacB/RNase II family 3'-5' exoribonuclease [Planctomycetota bacterium]